MNKPLKRIENFEKLGMGLFVHYGLYSLLGMGEWSFNLRQIPKAEYEALAKKFTAEKFSGEKLAKTAKTAGCKYIILTTRHHDGFSLYDTCGLNTYDAPHSAAGRDLIKDFVQGCKKYNILPVLYHTTLDWREKSFNDDFNAYKKYLRSSVEILCRNYGEIGGIWFDGDWSKPDADWETDKLYGMIRKYQPEAMIINNTGLEHRGKIGAEEIDCVTFERGRPSAASKKEGKHRAGEMCQIFNDNWGYAERDINYKSMKEIITDLCVCRRYRANFVINAGPRGDGSLRPIDKAMLEEIGRWISFNGKAVYEPKPCGIDCGEDDFVLDAGNGKYFLFVSGLTMDGDPNVTARLEHAKKIILKNCARIKSIAWLDNGEKLEFTQDGATARIKATNFRYGENLIVRVAEIIMQR